MFKVFNIVTIRNETKNIWWNNICPMIFHVNANLIVHHVIQRDNDKCQCECKNYHWYKKDYSGTLAHAFLGIA